MSHRRLTHKQFRRISWLLIAALVLLTVLPTHLHLHHPESDQARHEHVIDIHVFPADVSGAHHQDAQILKASPDGMLKHLIFKFLPFLLLVVCLTVVSLPVFRRVKLSYLNTLFPRQTSYLLLPPLRAPPANSH